MKIYLIATGSNVILAQPRLFVAHPRLALRRAAEARSGLLKPPTHLLTSSGLASLHAGHPPI
jgi:hypothetical protein